jgi:hypothetical protein
MGINGFSKEFSIRPNPNPNSDHDHQPLEGEKQEESLGVISKTQVSLCCHWQQALNQAMNKQETSLAFYVNLAPYIFQKNKLNLLSFAYLNFNLFS